jgi:NADH-quinone oxidoreductase subunit M
VAATFATVNIVLAAVYILWMYQRVAGGPIRDQVAGMVDLRWREVLAVAPLVVLIIGVGVYPKPVLDIINPAVKVTMAQVQVTDPVPAHPAPSPGLSTASTAAYLTGVVQKGIQP